MITGILVLNRYVCGGSFDERSMNGFFFSGYDSQRPERLEWEECN